MGRPQTVSDRVLLRQIALSPAPVASTAMVAADVDVTRQSVHSRLQQLEQRGLVRSYDVSGARVWWLTENGSRALLEEGPD